MLLPLAKYVSLGAFAATALAKELPKDEIKGSLLYDSGKIHMELMAKKEVLNTLPSYTSAILTRI